MASLGIGSTKPYHSLCVEGRSRAGLPVASKEGKMIKKLTRFFSEVKTEMKKVSWSTRKELVSSTRIVIVSVFFLALFIGIIDFIISRVVNSIIR